MSAVRQWPAAHPPTGEDCVETRCPACRLEWHVHRDMAGFRLRCECGSWVPVPALEGLRLPVGAHAAVLSAPTGAGGAAVVPVVRRPRAVTRVALEPGSLRLASAEERAAWTGRSLLEMIAVMAALIGPMAVVHLRYSGPAAAAALPIASLASGLLVLLVCATMGAYAFAGLRDAKPLHFVEALFVAGGTAGLALGYGEWISRHYDLVDPVFELRSTVGLGWTLFVVGLCPAIFEELAFRGLLQGRLMALLGKSTGLVVTAAAFALAHGATMGLPFHFFLGLYLGHMRERSGSLYPGMVMHLVYNSVLVVLAT